MLSERMWGGGWVLSEQIMRAGIGLHTKLLILLRSLFSQTSSCYWVGRELLCTLLMDLLVQFVD